jgi:Protein of unknown function (DUF3134)
MVAPRFNPALREEPRNQRAQVIPVRDKDSLFAWIENTGRFKAYVPEDAPADLLVDELEEIIDKSAYDLKLEDDSEEWEQDE